MDIDSTPHITHVERLTDAVIITFDDGRCALYSASLLNSIYPQAEPLLDDSADEDSVELV